MKKQNARKYALYRRKKDAPKGTRWERVYPGCHGSKARMVRTHQSEMLARFWNPEGYTYEIRALTKKEQEKINMDYVSHLLGPRDYYVAAPIFLHNTSMGS